ncbi:MAG TPA: hypothetical protein VM935_17945 [Chitinophagaceae bacterium]|nr:hypothetical protein [Chitinophagaceae bacterium]
MKLIFFLLISIFSARLAFANERTFVGSTPAHTTIRHFLRIPLTDSIDFIRWKLDLGIGTFKLRCTYGLAKPGTPGFSNEQAVAFDGQLVAINNHYQLNYNGKEIFILEVDANVLHFLDKDKQMLIGNGGYSFALNNTHPVAVKEVNIRSVQTSTESLLVFEGRTPCSDLPGLLGLNKSEACNKMKWYFLLYTDSLTGKPAYFLMGGMGYRKETMAKGEWQIATGENGRIIYRLHFNKWVRPLNLLKGDDNILFFIDSNGQPLVGNEDFSYTLNRKKKEYAPVSR